MGIFRKRERTPRAKVIDIRTGREKPPEPRTMQDQLDEILEMTNEMVRRLEARRRPGDGAS